MLRHRCYDFMKNRRYSKQLLQQLLGCSGFHFLVVFVVTLVVFGFFMLGVMGRSGRCRCWRRRLRIRRTHGKSSGNNGSDQFFHFKFLSVKRKHVLRETLTPQQKLQLTPDTGFLHAACESMRLHWIAFDCNAGMRWSAHGCQSLHPGQKFDKSGSGIDVITQMRRQIRRWQGLQQDGGIA